MAHVKIKLDSHEDTCSIAVDGVEMGLKVLADPPPTITLVGRTEAYVTLTIAADVLDVDLPDVVVDAIREDSQA